MQKDLTDIVMILDRSGSMDSCKADTILGFNKFIEGQKECQGKARFTLIQFDDAYEVNYENKDIQSVEPLNNDTFIPRNSTALLDAIARGIDDKGKQLEQTPEEQKPSKVIFVILTDGFENASRNNTWAQVADRIKHQQEVYNWVFVFLGANQDAIAIAGKMNIPGSSSLTYSPIADGTSKAYTATSALISGCRCAATYDAMRACSYTVEDRTAQEDLLKT